SNILVRIEIIVVWCCGHSKDGVPMQETVTGPRVFNPLHALSTLLLLAFTCIGAAQAQVVLAPSTPQVGSSNPVTAEPPVTRPNVKPCIVPLLTNAPFDNF